MMAGLLFMSLVSERSRSILIYDDRITVVKKGGKVIADVPFSAVSELKVQRGRTLSGFTVVASTGKEMFLGANIENVKKLLRMIEAKTSQKFPISDLDIEML